MTSGQNFPGVVDKNRQLMILQTGDGWLNNVFPDSLPALYLSAEAVCGGNCPERNKGVKQMVQSTESKKIQMILLDALVKVFPDERPAPTCVPVHFSVLRGDRLSFQLACRGTPETGKRDPIRFVQIEFLFDEPEWIHIRTVENVPVRYPAHTGTPEGLYLRKSRGIYPDVLVPMKNNIMAIASNEWRALWIDAEVPAEAAPGSRGFEIRLKDPQSGEILASLQETIRVLPANLPEQTFPRTEWFHADCLADAYHVGIFSEKHWDMIRTWIGHAVRRGINMILTPQFTPPLDTGIGWERPTVQLVEIFREGENFRFDFSRMIRWIRICLDCGVQYFEMSHLFSQWGAVAAPKIMGWEKGTWKQLFGWDTPAADGEYARFLKAYLPALRAVLKECGVEDRCWFHISDEPGIDQMGSYAAARNTVRDALAGCHFLEALSDYDFYQSGHVETPVCGINHLEPFLEHRTPHLWTYYCTAQSNHVSNCFIAQSSGLTRLYGTQMYKFGIEGSLRWGYNFYYTAYSYEQINPYLINDGGGCFPAGDAFLVYPGPDGQPQESIRMMVLDDAIRDLRALKALEAKIGREQVLQMIDEELESPLQFDVFPDYPEDGRYVLNLRQKVNAALCSATEE